MSVTAKYKRGEVIGRGNFGVVYKGVNLDTRQVVAIKVLDLDTAEDEVLDVQREISLLSRLSAHSEAANITRYFGSYLNGTKLWIIMDLCAGGSIRTLLKPGRLEEKYTSIIVREVLYALNYIHKAGVIHRDIKAANVLITTDGRVRLCDFGVAAEVSSSKFKRSTIVGTPYWMAPEVITEGSFYNSKADIWSLGITVYEIAVGNPPYSDQEAMRAIMLIPRQKPARLEGNQHSSALKEFVALCLDEHPNERPAADELLKTKFVKLAKNTPTTTLRDVVARYVQWKHKNGHRVRDSIAMLNNAKPLNLSDDEGDDSGAHDSALMEDNSAEPGDTVWDFDIDDIELSTADADDNYATTGVSGSDELTGLGLSTAGLDTVVNFGPSTNNQTMRDYSDVPGEKPPQSLLELFEEETGVDEQVSSKQSTAALPLQQLPEPQNHLMESMSTSASPTLTSAPLLPISTSVIEIEIPSFEDMNATARAPLSAAPTQPPLLHQQSAPAVPMMHHPHMGQSMTSVSQPTSGSGTPAIVPGRPLAKPIPAIAMASEPNLAALNNTNTMPPPSTTRRSPSPKRMEALNGSAAAMRPLNWANGGSQQVASRSASISSSTGDGDSPMENMSPLTRNPSKPALVPQLSLQNLPTAGSGMVSPARKNSLLSSRPVLTASTSAPTDSSSLLASSSLSQPQSTGVGPSNPGSRPVRPTNLRIAMPSPLYPQLQVSGGVPEPLSASGSNTSSSTHDHYEEGDTTLEDIPEIGGNSKNGFPSIPALDPNVFLDSTPRETTIKSLTELLGVYSEGLTKLEGMLRYSV